nr:EOG090X0P2R [Cyclestheria hislopi]
MASEDSQTSLENPSNDESNNKLTPQEIEKQEEAKLRARFPAKPMTGHSVFLQKRLQSKQKYFDSGDYQMAQQQQKGPAKIATAIQPTVLGQPTGDAIPTPESVPIRKTSIVQSKLASPAT